MKLIIKSDTLYYLILPINLKNLKEEEIITKIKHIFLKYNHKYHLLEPGFYEVDVYHHDIVGTVISIEKIDTFDFSDEVDLRVIIKNKVKVYLNLIDVTEFIEYKDKIDVDTLNLKEYLRLIEHSKIIIDTKKVLS
ncbi:MAG TPA: hypothetical protein IAB59_07380 [Candidatus Onthousia faecipullorum]|uniref:Uncharacterized protein n=1 Tax=Candidatus Onthousia faecipullorum TaxID=2840887 RepID=A0A9D1KBF4_9FIRM|nr:hypothetical protein [Candidatus Onthousia faecipullorum]